MQQAILSLSSTKNLGQMSLREIGLAATGENQPPQKVKHHLESLLEAKLLRRRGDSIERVSPGEKKSGFISLPILGAASCGPAMEIANEEVQGYLCLSEKFLPKKHDGLFVVRAVGSSMNEARVNGEKKINEGDFVVVDGANRQPKNGDYVLAITGGAANIKKFQKNKDGQIVLVSESTKDFTPIFVHADDDTEFFINGRVVDVFASFSKS